MANTLSRKKISMGILAHLNGLKQLLANEIQNLESKFVQLGIFERCGLLFRVDAKSMFI